MELRRPALCASDGAITAGVHKNLANRALPLVRCERVRNDAFEDLRLETLRAMGEALQAAVEPER